eukprot:scaffold68484_cov41-Cyclotella_meneghiniana.AAC.5
MQPMLNKLEKIGQIYQIFDGEWLSPCLLAPKPHQENCFNIEDFVWRLCVNYIELNRLTKVIAYPIPRCDFAVMISMGTGRYRWILDAPHGFHQLAVDEVSQLKLAFAGPYTRKYTYRVMPFGVVNGPVIFVIFMHDCKADWDELATARGIPLNDGTSTTIIIDDIHGCSDSWTHALQYLACIFEICLHRNLSLNLQKCHLFTPRFEFVGNDMTEDGIHPAQSKFDLIRNWADPKTVRDISKLLRFANFYGCYIPWMEVRVRDLRALVHGDYDTVITPDMWTDKCQEQWEFLKHSIISDPCLTQYDPNLRIYLKTDFAQVGMGYVTTQPNKDPASLAAMHRENLGGECEFLRDPKNVGAPPLLRPISMGSRKNKGYELRLHSHLGEAFALDWAIGQNRLYCYAVRNTNISDCYSLKFVMTYEGNNSVVLGIQMRLMLWSMDIVHRTRDFNIDSDYMSKLAADTQFDPLLSKYLTYAAELRSKYPAPDGEMKEEHWLGYRKKKRSQHPPTDDFLPGVMIDGIPIEDLEKDKVESSHLLYLCQGVSTAIQHYADTFSIHPIKYHRQVTGPIRHYAITRS